LNLADSIRRTPGCTTRCSFDAIAITIYTYRINVLGAWWRGLQFWQSFGVTVMFNGYVFSQVAHYILASYNLSTLQLIDNNTIGSN
jgi:hypothetical protein